MRRLTSLFSADVYLPSSLTETVGPELRYKSYGMEVFIMECPTSQFSSILMLFYQIGRCFKLIKTNLTLQNTMKLISMNPFFHLSFVFHFCFFIFVFSFLFFHFSFLFFHFSVFQVNMVLSAAWSLWVTLWLDGLVVAGTLQSEQIR